MVGLFNDMLKSDQTLFKNEVALDFSFQPKILPYRENEQRRLATCIKPLFLERTGKNVFVYGKPGIGKTAACKHVLNEIEEETDDILVFYINCWQKNTTYKIMLELCDILDYKFTQNRKTEELFNVVKQLVNRKSAVFVFDEVDKLEDLDFIYMLSEEIFRKAIVLITNFESFLTNLDSRIKSRIMPEPLAFNPYTKPETVGILKSRRDFAFYPGVWHDDSFNLVCDKAFEASDIRSGLHLMREAATIAENASSKKIEHTHVTQAVEKIADYQTKDKHELTSDEQSILELCTNHSGSKIGDLYKRYQEAGGKLVYKSFQRKIDKLQKNNFIHTEKTSGGKDGNTTFIKLNADKKLTDF